MSAISVGLVINKEQIMGIVYNPYADELYTAIKGEGAFLNGKRIQTSGVKGRIISNLYNFKLPFLQINLYTVVFFAEISRAIFAYELTLGTDERYYDLYLYRIKHLLKSIFG